ncbi:hypothetical protein SAMN05216241_104139 [Limimonas halophila]|uniref:Uncharacterized protein n=1 Tax=Limimonas halophila TaxID=1082479 RepID=A0A1G7QTH1_9PROT|nr:hypothetical protein [Limimonas halophila]SDG01821.1 hypothetical protein SAMN05216241_104139 [Limimonas halophila]
MAQGEQPERARLNAELALTEQLLRTETQHLQELDEKRRLITDGLADLSAPSGMWEHYLDEIDQAMIAARNRIDELDYLREDIRSHLEPHQ